MFKIYTKPDCRYCVHAKQVLKSKGLDFEEISATTHKVQLIEQVVQTGSPPPKTVPQIFHNDDYIGGYEQLVIYLFNIK